MPGARASSLGQAGGEPQAPRRRGTDGPSRGRRRQGPGRAYSETKEIVGGYFQIRAASYEEAVEIAEGCPHLEFGGSIEIREIDAV